MKPVIQTEQITFGYTAEPVLRDISFTVSPGEFVAIIGANGAGKSTLLRLLIGELHPNEGNIRLFGQEIRTFHDWPRIGYVPQNSAVAASGFPATVFEVVRSGLYHGVGKNRFSGQADRIRIMQALESVQMNQLSDRLISRLSGGQLQRVLVARALIGNPELLLLDEPTNGVDEQSVELMFGMLEQRCREGPAVVLVTHDMELVARYAQRALCIERTSMVALDQGQLKHEHRHRHQHPH